MSEYCAEQSMIHDRTRLLAEAFATDPFAVLANENSALFDVFQDTSVDDAEKDVRLDNYFQLVESLDRATFPDMQGEVRYGVPTGYLPDGFADMGTVDSLVPSERYGRSMNFVDTLGTLRRHKDVFAFVFSNLRREDFTGPNAETMFQQTIITNVASEIAMTLPYGDPTPAERGGILPISAIDRASCQQHGLTAQIILQAFGIRSRLSKNYLAIQKDLDTYGPNYLGGDHVSNVIAIEDGETKNYMFDSTNPQLNTRGEWMFGLFRLNQRATDGSWLVTAKNGSQRKYKERDNMYWTIQRPGY